MKRKTTFAKLPKGACFRIPESVAPNAVYKKVAGGWGAALWDGKKHGMVPARAVTRIRCGKKLRFAWSLVGRKRGGR